jgi:hypothetical protein
VFEALSHVNPYLAWVVMLVLFAVLGYGESRWAPKRPEIACLTWLWTLLVFSGGLFEAPFLGPLGPALALGALVTGAIVLVRYYQMKTKPRSR